MFKSFPFFYILAAARLASLSSTSFRLHPVVLDLGS